MTDDSKRTFYVGSFVIDPKRKAAAKRRTHAATVRDLSNLPDRSIVRIADVLAHTGMSERHLRRLWSLDPPQAPRPMGWKEKSPGGHNEWCAGDWKRWHVGVPQREWEGWR